MMLKLGRLLAGTLLALALAAPAAVAAPVTVNLRIEGATSTLYEGPVTADAATIQGHPCDVVGNGGTGSASATPTGALYQYATANGVPVTLDWFAGFSDFVVSSIAGAANTGAPTYSPSWQVAVNGAPLQIGGCQVALQHGDSVLWGYGAFDDIVLTLTGPVNVNVGETAQFVVRNGQNNVGLGGATVGSATTNADGVAYLTFSGVGRYTLKAQRPGAIRSNAVTICVHDGNDGNCGFPLDPAKPTPAPAPAPSAPEPPAPAAPIVAPDIAAPLPTFAGLRNRQRFARGKGPRVLRGAVADASGVAKLELRLQRKVGKRCFSFDGRKEAFSSIRCTRSARWFAISGARDWSYLLPSRLPRGLYQLQVRATDTAGNRSTNQSLRFRVA